MTGPLTRDEVREILRLGHNGDCSLRFAGADLPLTPAQALELVEISNAAEAANFPLGPEARNLAARLRYRLRDAIASGRDGTLRQAREAAGLTQTELAQRAGIGRATVERIEAGRSPRANLSTRRVLADALGVSVEQLWPEAVA